MGSSTGDTLASGPRPGRSEGGGPSTQPGSREGGRAFGLGPGRLAAIAAVAGAAVVVAVLLLGGGSGGRAGAAAKTAAVIQRYGGLPAWLPKPKAPVDRTLHASLVHQVVSIQGEGVSVDLPSGSVLVTAAGPEVPEEGHFPVPPVTPTTFIVTFANTTHSIPLAASSLAMIDERGFVHHPKVTAVGGGAPPAELTPGKPVSVKLHAFLPTGSGTVIWTPVGARPIVAWDYTVEID